MVPITIAEHVEVREALQTRLAKSCRRDLSVAFRAWLLLEVEAYAEFASLAGRASAREGAERDFQTVAILGFAAHAGVLDAEQTKALTGGLIWLAGRDTAFDGVPMPFCFDAVGILGVVLGTTAVADAHVTHEVVQWTRKFLRTSYEMYRAEDWHRCLLAVADRLLGGAIDLAMPKSAATADVRTALVAKGLIDTVGEEMQVDAVQAADLAVQELPTGFAHDRVALRLAAVEWVIRTVAQKEDRASAAVEGTITLPQDNLNDDRRGDIGARPKKRGRPTEIPEERKRIALGVKGGTARAKILYNVKYPTPQQVKNVYSILRNFQRTHRASE